MSEERIRTESASSNAPLINLDAENGHEFENGNTLNATTIPVSRTDSRAAFELLTEQSVLLIEDGILCRDIGHKMSTIQQIQIYRFYHSAIIRGLRWVTMVVLLSLAFFEDKNSLTLSPDPTIQSPRPHVPAGLTEALEIACLIIIGAMALLESWLVGIKTLKKKPWMLFLLGSVLVSVIDVIVTLKVPKYKYRFRRLLRPFIFIQSSSMMKKLLKSVALTVPEVLSVLLLLGFHLYFFTMIGMLVLPQTQNANGFGEHEPSGFEQLDTAIISLLVLLTTANNPDVMMPSYKQNRFCSLFFVVFSFVGTFLIMNLLTAVIYNQFRGFLQRTLQHSLNRRHIAFIGSFYKFLQAESVAKQEYLNSKTVSESIKFSTLKGGLSCIKEQFTNVPESYRLMDNEQTISLDEYVQILNNLCYRKKHIESTPTETRFPRLRSFQNVVIHPNFDHVGNAIAVLNAITLSIEIALYPERLSSHSAHSDEATEIIKKLRIFNVVISLYYLFEQLCKMWGYGVIYLRKLDFLFDGLVATALITIQILLEIEINKEQTDNSTELLWIFSRVVNILITMRLLRILPKLKVLSLITGALVDVLKNVKHCAGVLFAAFYFFAIVGILAFENRIDFDKLKKNDTTCGTYAELDYYSNNFEDFWSALILLWDLLVVNNWQVFLHQFSAISGWTQIYFVAWWLTSAVIILNIFVALILDNFIIKWERSQVLGIQSSDTTVFHMTLLEMYKDILESPSMEYVQQILINHNFISFPLAQSSFDARTVSSQE